MEYSLENHYDLKTYCRNYLQGENKIQQKQDKNAPSSVTFTSKYMSTWKNLHIYVII